MSETRIPEALALLREKGWCKGMDRSYLTGAHCIRGALSVACIDLPATTYITDHETIRDVISSQYGVRSVAGWNDDDSTTFEMVEAALEKAILERGGAL